jgi:hypothetical protein
MVKKAPSQLKNQMNAVQAQMTSNNAMAAATPAPMARRLIAPMAWSLASLISCLASSIW